MSGGRLETIRAVCFDGKTLAGAPTLIFSKVASRFDVMRAELSPPTNVVGATLVASRSCVTSLWEITFMPAPVSSTNTYGPAWLIHTWSRSPLSSSTRKPATPGRAVTPASGRSIKWAAPVLVTAHPIAARAPIAMKSFAFMLALSFC
jgi:hypothetical protein